VRSTPLHLAVRVGHEAAVRLLPDCSDINISLKDGFDLTPLDYAWDGCHEADCAASDELLEGSVQYSCGRGIADKSWLINGTPPLSLRMVVIIVTRVY